MSPADAPRIPAVATGGAPLPAPRSVNLAYVLAIAGWLTPVAGLHRLYLNRPVSGLLYLCTWGFLGIGTLIDLFRIPRMVDEANGQLAPPGAEGLGFGGRATPEQQILAIAEANGGSTSVMQVALHSRMSLKRSQKELDRLHRGGFCRLDVDREGNKLYVFSGMRPGLPLGEEDL